MPTSYSTLPALIQQSTTEQIAWPCDVTAQAGSGSPSAPTTTLFDLTIGKAVTLADPPGLSGNIISQVVRGSVLTPNHIYRLTFGYTIAGNVLISEVTLQCPD